MLVWVALGLYLVGFAFFAYFCLLADPETSKLAEFMSVRLPEYLQQKLLHMVGKTTVNKLHAISDHFLQIVYLVLVLGSWSIIFHFVYPMVTKSTHVSNYHKYIGYLAFVACMASWRYASTSNPGFITSRTLVKFDNYPYDNLLFVEGLTCPTVGIRKLARSKYDRFSKVHVARFDHYCGWLHNPIGEENYRLFLLFLLVHFGMCLYGSTIYAMLFYGEIMEKQLFQVTFFNTVTGEEHEADYWILSQYLFQRHFLVAGLFILTACMTLTLGSFLAFHVYITSRGRTTNEHAKWGQVKKWHRHESDRYKQAKRMGKLSSSPSSSSLNNNGTTSTASNPSSVVTDADVTCTGGATTLSSTVEGGVEEESSEIMDPGPMPKNIYHRGFVENWKEVVFPRSLRRDAIQRWQSSLHDSKNNNDARRSDTAAQPLKPKAS